ncbi:hypothetical protein QFZ79_000032 [Arthrobacter sp. V4I6]|uniref:hypothetical protein n=1 Tax=unclassified Arthrobacter TaxID=235627 RepID=UPI002787D959|nr:MULTISPECIES: hypothetical protein [unclassified Arthrobacter]MDQ0822285.1 hypothetical protein [Arthrobacter sp. V1I7]MDQ0851921.1 hypothetical protein [Arthrobacter sp. V4I6]
MLMRTDPFRELDRIAQQVFGTAAMPMDAWREGQEFVAAFDLPGVDIESVNLDVEQHTLTVRARAPTAHRQQVPGVRIETVLPAGDGRGAPHRRAGRREEETSRKHAGDMGLPRSRGHG